MNLKQAKELFDKYINNQCSPEELELLETFLDSYQDGNAVLFDNNLQDVKESQDKIWQDILTQIEDKTSRRKTYPFKSYLAYAIAASVVVFLAIGVFNQFDKVETETQSKIVSEESIKIGTDKAILTLEDGTSIALEKGKNYDDDNIRSDGERVIYQGDEQENVESKITYNYLTIPRGGQFFVKLSDGTQVWLNSETQLKYPVSFIKGQPRNVELVYGEAYFDVSPSKLHNGATFSVTSKGQHVEVLGTEFNVKAYQDEDLTYTTLVEGMVMVATENQEGLKLKPGQQVVLNEMENTLVVSSVDVYGETSWRNGMFSFKNLALKDIMTVLSRWYDVDVAFKDKEAENIKFNGVLSKHQDLEKILTTIQNTGFINQFEIENKKVTIE
ncbi:FecR family protein [Gelidibacter japonicus]|uniref:FecR family protein n=1 Tax=Gelidibacter japonicus TaxID=1962232 RepID=UPI0013CF5F13|nr:FecR domain-containing protein [Gelidibacter japonicus]